MRILTCDCRWSDNCFLVLVYNDLTKHCCFQRNFQLIFILWISLMALSSLSFSIAHFCYSHRCAAPDNLSNLGPQVIWLGYGLSVCQLLARPCISVRRCVVEYSEHRKSSPCIGRFSVSVGIPLVVNTTFQQYIRRCICRSCDNDIFQWNRECLFSQHIEFDSGLNMMIQVFPSDRPDIISGLHRHLASSLVLLVVETRLIFPESPLELILVLGCPLSYLHLGI